MELLDQSLNHRSLLKYDPHFPRFLTIIDAHLLASSNGNPCIDPDRAMTIERVRFFLFLIFGGLGGAISLASTWTSLS